MVISADRVSVPNPGSFTTIQARAQARVPQTQQEPEDQYGCLKAVGAGALSAAIDPLSIVASGAASAYSNARTIGRAAYRAGRILFIARATIPGALVAEAVLAAGGAAKAYFTDPRCR